MEWGGNLVYMISCHNQFTPRLSLDPDRAAVASGGTRHPRAFGLVRLFTGFASFHQLVGPAPLLFADWKCPYPIYATL